MSKPLEQDLSPTVSVVVPVLNELVGLPKLIESLQRFDFKQLVIVDGGSDDGSWQWLQKISNEGLLKFPVTILQSDKGRAKQMNAGAKICSSDLILFLHADTQLPSGIDRELVNVKNNNYQWGRFDVRFPRETRSAWLMSIVAFFINVRSSLSGIATGDQAIFINTALFQKVGGFPELPVMEDVAISKKLKQYSKPYCSRLRATTSPRRWLQNGIFKTVAQMWFLRCAFFCGVPAESLAIKYRNVR